MISGWLVARVAARESTTALLTNAPRYLRCFKTWQKITELIKIKVNELMIELKN